MKTNLKITISIVCIIMLHSCGNRIENNVSSREGGIFPAKKANENHFEDTQNFQLFWNGFRKAISSKNAKNITEFISIPFEVKGFEDRDPQFVISDKDSINKVFGKFLSEESIMYHDSIVTHFQLTQKIADIGTYAEYSDYDNNKRIENMEFSRNANGWKLYRVYMNTKKNK
ncbi:MAG: hypothetical protein P0Y49_18965 [Candidatus Pedobacter colombiensis]|uniref:Uncharacterized protein n=1 Tax=Candidatus Pedobacter colombiensis TaxID=3121371 RepID=A0AAJ5W779_9SPHI|nr:hypothetical protein [Pedobacter sp.]WEK18860.1 MAG: hypothetical protein P0Y49_18965 [Pedobacter sp.]